MPKTPSLDIAHIEESQEDKEVTANEAFDRLANAINARLNYANSDANFSLTTAQLVANQLIVLTGATTADRTVTLPGIVRDFRIWNQTGNLITLTTGVSPGAEDVVLRNGELATVHLNEVDVKKTAHNLEHLSGHIQNPAAETLSLIEYAPYTMEVLELIARTSAGDVTLAIDVAGTPVTGINGVNINESQSSNEATAANDVQVGEKVTLDISAIGSPTPADLQFTVVLART